MSVVDPGRSSLRPRLYRRLSGLCLCSDSTPDALIAAVSTSDCWGVLSTAGLTDAQLDVLRRGMARRQSARSVLHPLLAPGQPLQRQRVATYREKDLAVSALSDWAQGVGLPRRLVSAFEQAVDELLLNALFDAPCDEQGQPRYMADSPQQRLLITARPGEEAELRYAADEHRVVVGVRDSFGRLRRGTVLEYFRRCAAAQATRQSPLEQKTGGSGVGLYLVLSAASELLFRLHEGQATEVVFTLYRQRPFSLRALWFDELPTVEAASAPVSR